MVGRMVGKSKTYLIKKLQLFEDKLNVGMQVLIEIRVPCE